MAWMKRPRRSPIDLGTRHLDEVLAPEVYTQPFAGRASKANGYPFEGVAGILEVREWNGGNVIATFTSWDRGIAKRTYYNGSWRPWLDPTGKAVA